MPKQPSLPSSIHSVMPGPDPIGCALEDGEFLCERRNARDELDGARGVPNHPDVHAALMEIAPPACGMELRALEALEAGEVRDERPVELATAAYQDVRHNLPAVAGSNPPYAVGLVEAYV